MENIDIARRLEDMADLLEIQGANPFRIRAYRNAARTVKEHPTPLRKLVAEDADLTALPAVGKDIAAAIGELERTGKLQRLEDLAKEVPLTLIDLTRLPGVGAKKAKRLWDDLGVTTLESLYEAAQGGSVATLPGFGAKTQKRILDGIRRLQERETRFKLADAEQYVVSLLDLLRKADGVERVEVAGSYRRRKEAVGDIDLLATTTDSGPVLERFVGYEEVERVEVAGDTKATVHLRGGLQVDLRIVSPKSFGAALLYFTGSKAHNVKLRRRALDRGLRISEYGVFRGADDLDGDPWAGEFVAGATEQDVYETVGLPWIPAELREDRGEIEVAASAMLPALIVPDAMRGDLHMHSTWSDGRNSIAEMVDACAGRGYEYVAITDHSKVLAMTGGLDAVKLREQWVEIADLATQRSDIRILRGMEVDILADGALDLEDEMLAELDIVLVSVHSRFDLSPAEQTKRVLAAVQHPATHILAHPTGRQINRRDPMRFDLDAVLECAAEHDVAVEINAHPNRLDLSDTAVMQARKRGASIVINTDAHWIGDLDLMKYGVDQARRAWLTPEEVLNTLPLQALESWLNIDS